VANQLSGPFVCRCLTSGTLPRFHLPLIEPDKRISRIRLSEKASRLLGRVAPSVVSGRWLEFVGSRQSPVPHYVLRCLQPGSLPSIGVTRLPRYYGPLRHPAWPGLSLTGFRLATPVATRGASRVATENCPGVPSPLPRRDHSSVGRSVAAAMTAFTVRSRLGSRIEPFEACSAFTHVTAHLFARPPEAAPYIEGSDGFVTSTAAPIATGRSDPVAGRDLHPQALSAFARRTSKRFSPGNPIEGAPNGLATRVSAPCRVRSSLRWARDPEASVSTRDLTLTLVTLSSYARPLRIRTCRGFHDRYEDLRAAFPLKKISPFYLL
jgi:hypothetical protein